MNKLLLITLILNFVLLHQARSQSYRPMAKDGVHWIVELDHEDTPYPVDGIWEYYCNGDTSINNIDYKKIYKRDLEITQNGPPFTAISEYVIAGFLRDDTVAKKVYSIDWEIGFWDVCPDGEEHLLYDFSLNVNDSADFCLITRTLSINNIYYANLYNQQVKIFAAEIYEYFEGIGSFFGLFEEMEFNEFYVTILHYYCTDPCEYLVTTNNISLSEFKVFPNPANEIITLELGNENDWKQWEVYNSIGTKILSQPIVNGTKLTSLKVSDFPSGFYFCRLTNNFEKSMMQKIVVMH